MGVLNTEDATAIAEWKDFLQSDRPDVRRTALDAVTRLAGEPGVTVFDSYAFFTQVLSNPAGYGLANVTDACGALPGCDPSTYFFWDGIHPTQAGHALMSQAWRRAVGI